MDSKVEKAVVHAVMHDILNDVKNSFKKQNLKPRDSIFDYELLKTALCRNDQGIVKLLLKTDCKVVNPDKNVSAEETPLHLAIKNGQSYMDYDIVRKLIDKGASIYDKNLNGETPVYAAFKKGDIQDVKTLLRCGKSKLVPVNKDDILHFHIACVINEYHSVERYLQYGFNPNNPLSLGSKEYTGLNPIQYAIKKNHFELFVRLAKYNGDLYIKNTEGLTPLHMIYYSIVPNNGKSWIEQAFKYGNNTKFINSEDEYGVSHFHLCCTIDEPDFVQEFLDNGANVNNPISLKCRFNPGFTPLHFAVNSGCEKVIKLLLKNGADPNKLDGRGKTPLHLACEKSGKLRRNIVKILLEYKAIPDIADKKGCTPLHKTFYYKEGEDLQIFNALMSKLQWGTDNYTDKQGLSLFHIACTTNNVNQVIKFLDSGVNIDSHISSGIYRGFTALHFAVMCNQIDVVKVLLKRNAKVNEKTGRTGLTPLHLACEFNYMKFDHQESMAKVQGSCCIVTNYDLISLDLTSSRSNQLGIIELLLSYGSDVNAKDTSGITPLLYACMIDENYLNLDWTYLTYSCSSEGDNVIKEISIRLKEIIKILISNKAHINSQTNKKLSILHIICKYSTLKLPEKFIKFLVYSGADVNAVNAIQGTPLHVAVEHNNKMLVTILLKHNANPNVITKYFLVPLLTSIKLIIGDKHSLRSREIQKDIFCALLENGSDVNMRIPYRPIFLHTAITHHKYFMIEKLLYYGADINIKNSDGQPCIDELIEWERESGIWFNDKNAKVFQIIFIHVQKLLALGLPVSQETQKCCAELYPHYKSKYKRVEGLSNLDNIFDNCINELDKMKNVKINCYTSLYDILLKDPHELAKYSSLIKVLKEQNVDSKFPLYGYLLQLQFKRGLSRSEVLQSAEASLANILNVRLPDVCYNLILKYLRNEEIVNLKEVTTVKHNLKRKLCDSNSNQTETVSKLQKKETGPKIMELRLTRIDDLSNRVCKPVSKSRKN